MSIDLYQDVRDFHDKFAIPRVPRPVPLHRLAAGEGQHRLDHLQEELDELKAAAEVLDVVAEADALVDLVYVAIGTAVMQGVPFDAVWDAVHAANMQKALGHGPRKQNVTKPPGWQPPDVAAILLAAGEETVSDDGAEDPAPTSWATPCV